MQFFCWLNTGKGNLVTGGKSLLELKKSGHFTIWAVEALRAGLMRIENKDEVDAQTGKLKDDGKYKSNDPHILALAIVSGVRLLYTNDRLLHGDFGNKRLIDNPRGKVYSTLKRKSFTNTHRALLRRKDLCQVSH